MEGIKPTVIIAIGGGSCIDMSKGIAYFGRKLKHMDIKSFIAVPTTSGTGSEVTSFAVLTDSETKIKYPLMDDAVSPDEALLTPLFVKHRLQMLLLLAVWMFLFMRLKPM